MTEVKLTYHYVNCAVGWCHHDKECGCNCGAYSPDDEDYPDYCTHLSTEHGFTQILHTSVKKFEYQESEWGWYMVVGNQHFSPWNCEIISLVVDGKTIVGSDAE